MTGTQATKKEEKREEEPADSREETILEPRKTQKGQGKKPTTSLETETNALKDKKGNEPDSIETMTGRDKDKAKEAGREGDKGSTVTEPNAKSEGRRGRSENP